MASLTGETLSLLAGSTARQTMPTGCADRRFDFDPTKRVRPTPREPPELILIAVDGPPDFACPRRADKRTRPLMEQRSVSASKKPVTGQTTFCPHTS